MIEAQKYIFNRSLTIPKTEILKCAAYGLGIFGVGLGTTAYFDHEIMSASIEDLESRNRLELNDTFEPVSERPKTIVMSESQLYRLREADQLKDQQLEVLSRLFYGILLTIPTFSLLGKEAIDLLTSKKP